MDRRVSRSGLAAVRSRRPVPARESLPDTTNPSRGLCCAQCPTTSRQNGRAQRATGCARSAARFRESSNHAATKRSTARYSERSRACQRSQAICIPNRTSGVEPKDFDSRIAISTETPERSFTSSDSACRVTPYPLAARVTSRPRGSRHCLFTMPPGCGGLCIPRTGLLSDSPRNPHRRPRRRRTGTSRASCPIPKPHNVPSSAPSTRADGTLAGSCPRARGCDQAPPGCPPSPRAPALGNAGYKPVRIDRKERSGRIDDEIIAGIRRARFLVCDLTCGLPACPDSGSEMTAAACGSIHYEAGFAHGPGKLVIWTCRKDLIEHACFDVRQRDIISREAGKERVLRKALDTRVRAVIA